MIIWTTSLEGKGQNRAFSQKQYSSFWSFLYLEKVAYQLRVLHDTTGPLTEECDRVNKWEWAETKCWVCWPVGGQLYAFLKQLENKWPYDGDACAEDQQLFKHTHSSNECILRLFACCCALFVHFFLLSFNFCSFFERFQTDLLNVPNRKLRGRPPADPHLPAAVTSQLGPSVRI